MPRPYALLRAGFPYHRTIGEFIRTSHPHDVAVGKNGRLYVLTTGNSGPIHVTNVEDDDLGSFGVPGFGFRLPSYKCSLKAGMDQFMPGHVVWPVQVAVDSDEVLYISDEGAQRITIYDRFGNFRGHWGTVGNGPGEFDRPAGLAFDSRDYLYIADGMNHRIQKYTKDGGFVSQWGGFGEGPGQFNMPWGVTTDDEDFVYVADWKNDRIQKFDPEGGFVFSFGTPGRDRGQMHRPSDVAVDADGDIYVCDWGNNRVLQFDAQGRYLKTFTGDATLSKTELGRMWSRPAKYHRMRNTGDLELTEAFQNPRSVVVDRDGHLLVPDMAALRIQIYKKEAYPLTEAQILPPFKSETLQNF